jgi:hypothetical protein
MKKYGDMTFVQILSHTPFMVALDRVVNSQGLLSLSDSACSDLNNPEANTVTTRPTTCPQYQCYNQVEGPDLPNQALWYRTHDV